MVKQSSERMKQYNKEHKDELVQARAAARARRNRAAILSHLSDATQEFTRDDLNEWGYSNEVITRLKKQSIIQKISVKSYILHTP